MKHYGQAWAIARALDLVGEQWSLLLRRGPARLGTAGRRRPADRPARRADLRAPGRTGDLLPQLRRRHAHRPPRPGAARRSRSQAGTFTCLETTTHLGGPVMSDIRSETARAAAPGGVAAGGPRPGLALLVLAAAQLMVVLDATIVNVALPHIQRALGFSGTNLEWVVNAYALAFGGLLLLGGRAGDLLGRRTMFIAGLLLFSAASLAGGFANSEAFLLTARAVQGAGGALVAPAALSLITTTFPEGPPRTRAFGVYAAMSIAGGAIGLIGGGVLTTYASWRGGACAQLPLRAAVSPAAPRRPAATPRRPPPVHRRSLRCGGRSHPARAPDRRAPGADRRLCGRDRRPVLAVPDQRARHLRQRGARPHHRHRSRNRTAVRYAVPRRAEPRR